MTNLKLTIKDLEYLREDEPRYELIDGVLFVTRSPHWQHQKVCLKLSTALDNWSEVSGTGDVVQSPGIIFSDCNNVIPDLVWVSKNRLSVILDASGHLTAAPELIIEVVSESTEKKDRELKLKLYSQRGVLEYWLADWRKKQIEVYRRNEAQLELVATLREEDNLNSPLLPDFSCVVGKIFA